MEEFEGFHPRVSPAPEEVIPTDLEQELAACRKEQDRLLRQMADTENARKRANREEKSMATRQIPQEQWGRYFDSLSHQARTTRPRVTVLVEAEDLGVEPVAEGAQLRAIFYEEKGSEGHSLDIEVGDDVSGDRLVQRVDAQTVWVEESAGGDPLAFDIEGIDPESQSKIKTIIRFET